MKTLRILMATVIFATIFTGCENEEQDPMEVAYAKASESNGGIMYDKFWATESNFSQTSPHLATVSAKADFFRCKQCHAWDLLGSNGSYINRGPNANRPIVSPLNIYQLAQAKTTTELFEGMKKTNGRRDIDFDLTTYDPENNFTEGNKMPNYTQLLSEAQLWDIVKFLKEGAIDVGILYDATYTGTYPTGSASYTNIGKDGNASNGKAYYAANCASCHGANGTQMALEGKSVGDFTRSKPYEVQQKVKYGQLGSIMAGEFDITDTQMKDLYKALASTTDFPAMPAN